MRRWIGSALVIGLVLGSGIGYAAAQCASGQCLFLPIVQATSETCDTHAPPSPNLAGPDWHVWMTRYTVIPGDSLLACFYTSTYSPGQAAYVRVQQSSGTTESLPVEITGIGPIALPIQTAGFIPGELIAIDFISDQGKTAPPVRHGQSFVFVRAP